MSKILNYGRLRELEKESTGVDGMGYKTSVPTPQSFQFLLDLLNLYVHGETNGIIEETLLSQGILQNIPEYPMKKNKLNVTPHKFGE